MSKRQPIEFAMDTSTNAAVCFQSDAERRPQFVSDGEVAYLHFDGKDDSLLWNLQHPPLASMTVCILAAPHGNAGNFAGIFATSDLGKNDYTSGFNLDQGPAATTELSVLNVEGAGAAGFRDLLERGFVSSGARAFGDFHVFTVRSAPGKAGIQTYLDGFKGGERDRAESMIALRQLTVGARIYSNDATQPPFVQGSFNGAIAEVLAFDHALSEEERQAVENALLAKIVPLNALLHGARGHALETAKNPPVVQMLVPGFRVDELPLKIGNLNNVRYRYDGKVVGLGYDGRIHLLTDTDGDGLEDKDELFWERPTLRSPIGMALLPQDDPRGDGLFVASKGKVSLILDKDRDGRGDEEKVIATGWDELTHGVDALGVALEPKDGSIYFGLGCADFVDAYQIDRTTRSSRYRLDDLHGTIQRISADFSKRETVCTGVRFTCALAFNAEGDLFATDQEGATWLPNGNPLDELLQIQKDKHYGFPPRHPKHLPSVIDEPPVSEFPPQHQSTVGMVFNEGVNGGPPFGPAHWAGDALICGESRGKLWRTKLAKTPLGYVAQNHLIACLGLLTVDSCVTTAGDLLVACHSGPPDWGTGPTGEGRLFKIRYTARDLPQPVMAWAAAPDEFRISFDRPLDPNDWKNSDEAIKVEAGLYVSPGDRFEVIRPGYQVVRDQLADPRQWIKTLGVSFTEDLRTMVLRVARSTEAVNYAITLPVPKRWRRHKAGISQVPEMDIAVNLNGLLATASRDQGEIRTVLPHPSLPVSEKLTTGSLEHERFLEVARRPNGHFQLEGQVVITNPFVPAVQPGSKLDWDPNSDAFASARFTVQTDRGSEAPVTTGSAPFAALKPVTLPAEGASNGLFLAKDSLRHALAPTRLFLPWAREAGKKADRKPMGERSYLKENWERGRKIFFGEIGCATCHTIRGEGASFGPDLSNLVFRDRESVLSDILHPSATINPDHAGTTVSLKNGTALAGLVRSLATDSLKLALPAGGITEISRGDVLHLELMRTSLMPEGLVDRLTRAELDDLLTFLLNAPAEPASGTEHPGKRE